VLNGVASVIHLLPVVGEDSIAAILLPNYQLV